MSARVIPDRRANHGGGQVPLAQQAGNNGSIIKDKFTHLFTNAPVLCSGSCSTTMIATGVSMPKPT